MAMLLLGLAGCDGIPDSKPEERASREISVASQELDALAQESGALPGKEERDPVGRYARRYEGGSDRLCLIAEDGKRGRYRFGAETRIGEEEYCRGTGTATLSKDKLLLRFGGNGSACLVVARYEGDGIVLPGALDLSCAALCSSRGSFAGARFPRIDHDPKAAQAMTDATERPLCR